MTNPDLYYKESGKVGVLSLPLMPLAALATAAVLGAVYAYAIFYIPFIYLNFFLTVFYGIAIGFVVGKTGIFTKARNKMANLGIGLFAGLAGVYFQWAFWIHAASEQELLTFDPLVLGMIIQNVAHEGAWSIFGWTPTGAALYVIWAIEALIITGAAVIFALSSAGRKPFCEDCNEWAEEVTLTKQLAAIENHEELVAALERNDTSGLTKLRNVSITQAMRTQVQLLSCPDGGSTHFLTLDAIMVTVNDKGEAEEDEIPIIENLKLTLQAFDEILAWSKKLDEPLESVEDGAAEAG